jgi:hypothetical protein
MPFDTADKGRGRLRPQLSSRLTARISRQRGLVTATTIPQLLIGRVAATAPSAHGMMSSNSKLSDTAASDTWLSAHQVQLIPLRALVVSSNYYQQRSNTVKNLESPAKYQS